MVPLICFGETVVDVQVVGIVVDQVVVARAEAPLGNGVIPLEVPKDVRHKRPGEGQGRGLLGLLGISGG